MLEDGSVLSGGKGVKKDDYAFTTYQHAFIQGFDDVCVNGAKQVKDADENHYHNGHNDDDISVLTLLGNEFWSKLEYKERERELNQALNAPTPVIFGCIPPPMCMQFRLKRLVKQFDATTNQQSVLRNTMIQLAFQASSLSPMQKSGVLQSTGTCGHGRRRQLNMLSTPNLGKIGREEQLH